MNDETLNIPFSERETPNKIDDAEEGSYTKARLEGDYNLFLEGTSGFDENKPVEEKQKELFKMFEKGEVEDPGQAWEWWFGKKWQSWSAQEADTAMANSPDTAKDHLQMLARRRG